MKEKKVEFVSLPYVFNLGDPVHLVIELARGANKFIDVEAMFARAWPMVIDRANSKLHPRGLHLVVKDGESSPTKARIFHRADGKTGGTKKEKLRRVKEILEAECHQLLEALLQQAPLRNAKSKTKPKKKARSPSQPKKRLKRTLPGEGRSSN